MKKLKTLSLVAVDSFIIIFAIFCGRLITERPDLPPGLFYIVTLALLLFTFQLFAYIFNLYQWMWQYASIREVVNVFYSVSFSILTSMVGVVLFFRLLHYNFDMPVSLFFIAWLIELVFIGGLRLVGRIMYLDRMDHTDNERVLIFGAGRGGAILARQMNHVQRMKMTPVVFLDDDPDKHKRVINGVKVVGDRTKLEETIQKYNIDKVVIAMPSLARNKVKELYDKSSACDVKVQIMPDIDDILAGRKEVSMLKNIDLEDLLGRDPVVLDSEEVSNAINNKTILVTGAGGSIGSEIVRQISKFGPKEVILLGHGENSIYLIHQEMMNLYKDGAIKYIPVIADIQDRDKIFSVMTQYKPAIVYHAAAHKHVPMMEANPREAVKNNILGTKNVAEACAAAGVETFVMVSTDKAVNPPNIMGATKRWAEMIIQNMNGHSATTFVGVRFGNVLGSRGSVIPLFQKQIAAGGPVTVTHPDITRYFMTIPEASRLVIQAGALAQGGEIFVLDMGQPMKIADLAKNVIELSGNTVEDIGIEFTGLRPGEKMYEELLNENEVSDKQVHDKIYVGKAVPKDYHELLEEIDQLLMMDKEQMKEFVIREANKKFYNSQMSH
ncbi:polysaccharide biosynthesis protein [Macrococcus bovicus]